MLQTEAAQHQIQTSEFITAATDNSSRVFLPWWAGCVCTAITGWVLIAFPPQPLLQGQTAPSLKEIRERRKREFQLKEVLFFMVFHENCCAKEQTHETMDSKAVNKTPRFLGCSWVPGKFSQKSIYLMWISLFMLAPNTLLLFKKPRINYFSHLQTKSVRCERMWKQESLSKKLKEKRLHI